MLIYQVHTKQFYIDVSQLYFSGQRVPPGSKGENYLWNGARAMKRNWEHVSTQISARDWAFSPSAGGLLSDKVIVLQQQYNRPDFHAYRTKLTAYKWHLYPINTENPKGCPLPTACRLLSSHSSRDGAKCALRTYSADSTLDVHWWYSLPRCNNKGCSM